MRIREDDGLTVHRDGLSLPETVHGILMRNYARLPMLEDETHEPIHSPNSSSPKPSN